MTIGATITVVAGCANAATDRAKDEARSNAANVGRLIASNAVEYAAFDPRAVINFVEAELEEDVGWWEQSSADEATAVWRFRVGGSADYTGALGEAQSVLAQVCGEATLTFATSEVTLTDIDCPEEFSWADVDEDLGPWRSGSDPHVPQRTP
ncbi:hypothetical protein CTE05_25430 [Cellulomonas terrae]|uniref:Uncharacterized protein n=1 Tax=Cellulomonas terrae TaxID=311234 RepID=A0A511JLZ6_9CELL|nr:hypothetical protein CTE05_25430 [Cellulomonas terrae]